MPQEDALAKRARLETSINRNPHPDFQGVEASRPAWQSERSGWTYTKIVNPDWKFGDGGNDGGASLEKEHVEINPYAEGRPATFNYKLLISAIVPRPIGFLSTVGQDGMCLCWLVFPLRVADRDRDVQSRPIQLHEYDQLRSPAVHGWLHRLRHRRCQGHAEEPDRHR